MKVDGVEIVIESDASKACKELDKMIAKLGDVNAKIRSTGRINIGKGGTSGATSGLKTYSATASKATKSTYSLASAFGKFYASCFLFIRGAKALGKAIESSMDYIETYNYYNVIMDKIGTEFGSAWKENGYNSANEYAKSFKERLNNLTGEMTGYKIGKEGGLYATDSIGLGLDPEKLMSFQAEVSSITNAVGLIGETSVNTSKALTMLSADLSSLKNQDLQSVMTNLRSGLIGQSRALYKYGIDITNNTLAEYALANGIKKKVSEMTQAEKMQLRMLAILGQSKVAYGDMANTINGVANQYRIFKQQVSNLARIIGNLFIPVLQAVLPYVNGFVIALQRLFTWIGNLIGVDWSKMMDGISSGYNDTGLDALGDSADDTTDALDSADKAAKKLKATIHGYDELHVATDPTSGASSDTGSGSSFDLSGAIGDALGDYQSVWDEAMKGMENRAGEIADKISDAFEKVYKVGKYTFNKFKTGFDNAYISDKLQDVVNNFGRIKESNIRVWTSQEVLSAMERFISTSIQKAGAIAGAFASVGTSISYGITEGIADAKEQMEYFNIDKLTGTFENLTGINLEIIGFSEAIASIGTAFESDGFVKIVTFFEKVREFFTGTIMENVTGFALDITKIFTDPIEKNQDSITGILESLMTIASNLVSPLESLFDVLIKNSDDWEDSWLHKLLTAFNSSNLTVTSVWLDTLNDKLAKLAEFTTNHNALTFFDSIKEKFEEITNFCQPAITAFQGLFDRLKSGFEGVSIIVQAFATAIFGVISEKLNPVISKIGDTFSYVYENIKSVWIGVKTFFSMYVIKPIDDLFGGLWDSISGGLKNAMNVVLAIFEGAVNALIGGINSKIEGFNNLAKGAAGFIGKDYSGISKIPEIKIPGLATGGCVPFGTPIRVNEYGTELIGSYKNSAAVLPPSDLLDEIGGKMKSVFVESMMEVSMASGLGENSNNQSPTIVVQFADMTEVGVKTYIAQRDAQRRGLIPKMI